jgi:hypothetical protein
MIVNPFSFLSTTGNRGRLIQIGQQFGGGSVGAIYGNYPNQYGVIVANENISGSYSWGNDGVVSTTYPAVLSGSVNTSTILAFDSNAYPAKFCSDYTGSGYTDWVLPTSNDLLGVLPNNAALAVPFNSNSDTAQTIYWTSYTLDITNAYVVDFRTNAPSPFSGSVGNVSRCCGQFIPGPGLPFRPVRYFDYRT